LFFKKNRAQAAMEFLQELNNDVSGSFVEEVQYIYTLSFLFWNKFLFLIIQALET
jgi:hypothetical protein